MQQTTKARVEIRSLVSEEIHMTRAFHNLPDSKDAVQKYMEKEESLDQAQIDGYHYFIEDVTGVFSI